MSGIFLAIVIVMGVTLVGLLVVDIVVTIKRRDNTLTLTRLGRYFNDHLLRFNAFVLLLLFCVVWVVPLVVGVLGSFTSKWAFEYQPGHLFPSDGFTFDNYIDLFNQTRVDGTTYPVGNWLLNSFIVATASTFLYLLVAGAAAYAFVFLNFRFRDAIFGVMLFTMVIPGIATLTPQLANIANLGIARTLWALILPGLGGVGGMYLIRQFYLGIPKDLI